MADTFALLDDFMRDLETAQNIPAAGELRVLARELRERVLSVKDDPDAWLPALEYVAGAGWQRLETAAHPFGRGKRSDPEYGRAGRPPYRGRSHQQPDLYVPALHRAALAGAVAVPRGSAPPLLGDADMPVELGESYRALVGCAAGHTDARRDAGAMRSRSRRPDATARQRWTGCRPHQPPHLSSTRRAPGVGPSTRSWRRPRLLAQDLLAGLQQIDDLAETYFREMDFGFLFEPQRQVFHIGYNVTAGKLDGNFYDLLASEARIASLVALAKHEVPRSHWLHLARPITRVDGTRRSSPGARPCSST